ncbi:MAG: RNA polymerase factor sigma-54 [Anaerotignum sp.]|nr:RNA polymerase factor sigma-54 [Anaerotignum sp.]
MELSLELRQKQVLSPQMQQSVELLQMNLLAFSEYVKDAAEENPLLEWEEEDQEKETLLQKLDWLAESDEQNRGFYRIEQEEDLQDIHGKNDVESLKEYIFFQIHTMKGETWEKAALSFLAECMEDSGYLPKDAVESLQERLHLDGGEAERLISMFQTLDPVGVGARSLQECLLLQLKEKQASPLSLLLVEEHLEELAKNHIQQVAKKQKVPVNAVIQALAEIRSCQPKPGSGFVDERTVEYVVPDILVEKQGDALVVRFNQNAIPHLRINTAYADILRAGAEKETEQYIAEKVKQAEWMLQCMHRREVTLQKIAECIVEVQKAFFLEKDGQLVPLRMIDVATHLEMHESTISRGVKDKYLQCEKGIFPLHMFFSKAMQTTGDETISADHIHNKLKELILQEDKKKPLSDRVLTEGLQAEGICISRRTVAKYREEMGIPSASGRKEY